MHDIITSICKRIGRSSLNYNYEFLKSKEIVIGNRMVGRHGQVFNKLYAMFPVEGGGFKGCRTPWVFKCICGNFTVQSYSSVARGQNKSCGCHRKVTGNFQSLLNICSGLVSSECKVTLVQEGTDTKSRDWGFICNTCGIERYSLNAWEVLKTDKKFCACSGKITCNTREEAIQDLEQKIQDSVWKLEEFPETFTNKKDCKVKVKCKECNTIHEVRFGNAYRKGCPSCANKATAIRLNKDTDWFIEKCNDIHNFKYDYSKVKYKRAKEKVEIVCHDHKTPFTFLQSPDNHKNKGKGCPECKRLRLKHVGFKLARAEQNKDIYKNLNSGVYLTLIGSKIHKIGITCDLDRRNPEIRRESGLNVSTEHYRPLSLYDALHLENQLHIHFEDVQFKWDYEWAGHTECFLLDVEQQEYVKDFIDNYEVIDE